MADLTPKTIAELPEDTSLTGSELFPVMDGAYSRKIPLSTLNSQFQMTAGGTQADGEDLDALLTPGTYYVYQTSSVTGTPPPVSTSYKLFVTRAYSVSNVPRLWQIAYEVSNPFKEHRRFYGSSGWSSWETLNVTAVNSALSALSAALSGGNVSFSRATVINGSNTDIAFSNNEHGFIFITSAAGNSCGVYAFQCGSAGAMYITAIKDGSLLTLTGSTNNINVANGAAYYAYCLIVKF